MSAVRKQITSIQGLNDPLNLVSSGPLCITSVLVDPSDVLSHFDIDRIQEPVVQSIERVRKYKLGPGEDSEFVGHSIERVGIDGVWRVVRGYRRIGT